MSRTQPSRNLTPSLRAAAILLAAGACVSLSVAGMQPDPGTAAATPIAASPTAELPAAVPERSARSEDTTTLGFKNVTVDQLIPFITEATGKVVLPQADVLARRVTILNDAPISKRRAYELVVFALQQNGVAVMEEEDHINIRALEEIDRQDVKHIGADESVLGRTDIGTIVEKVFALKNASAANLNDQLKTTLPAWAKMFVDADSNQIVVMGNIGLLQRIERLLLSLDKPAAASLSTETFHLRYTKASTIATNITDLYGQTNASRTGQQGQNPFNPFGQQRGGQQGGGQQQRGGGQPGGGGTPGNRGAINDAQTSQNLRVTANTEQNTVTVLAEKGVIEQIAKQIAEAWDRPLPGEQVTPRIYHLKNSDPIKVRDTLNSFFNGTTTAGGGGNQNQNRSGQDQAGANRLQGQFSFEAMPDAGQLLVTANSPDKFEIIDKFIEDLDKAQSAGLPQIVELKHADAEELAEQLNAILSQEGTLAQITKSQTGLSSSATSGASPFATSSTTSSTSSTSSTNTNNNGTTTTPGTITLWWQRARVPTTTVGASNLVGKIRIVPVWRQNSLLVMTPPEYHDTITQLVRDLDRPGRQVLITAVITEITLENDLSIGIRTASQSITPAIADNAISLTQTTGTNNTTTQTFTGTKNNLLPGLFNNSVLNVGANVNMVLQALAQDIKINILSEPRIFTSDNQEADFFSGQDIPFITNSQTSSSGNLVQSFDYKAVGISLSVRPRITTDRDIDLSVNLALASIEPNQTLFGGFIIDRRQTTTNVIIKDGQTVVVSGIIRSENQETKRKVPLLGDIPIVGELFKSTDKSKTKTELIAFITPHVVGTPEESGPFYAPDRERLDRVRSTLQVPADPVPGAKAPETPPAPPAPEDRRRKNDWPD